MTQLRDSQVETLRFIDGRVLVTRRDVADEFGIGRDSARSRLAGLYVLGLLAFEQDGARGTKIYRLTQLGREALEGQR